MDFHTKDKALHFVFIHLATVISANVMIFFLFVKYGKYIPWLGQTCCIPRSTLKLFLALVFNINLIIEDLFSIQFCRVVFRLTLFNWHFAVSVHWETELQIDQLHIQGTAWNKQLAVTRTGPGKRMLKTNTGRSVKGKI